MENPQNKFYKFCPNCKTPLRKKIIDARERLTCEKCKFILWGNPKPTMSVILVKDGKVLLLKRAHEPFGNHWVLPGGYMEYDETPKEAFIRETKEETGLDIATVSLVDAYLIDTDPRGNSLDIVYAGQVLNGKITLKSEHSAYKFFLPDALPEQTGYNHRQMIINWFKKHTHEG